MKKVSRKKMPVTFCEEYMGLFYFFLHFYATDLHSFMGHIGSHQWWLELISDYKFVPLCSENFEFLLHALKQGCVTFSGKIKRFSADDSPEPVMAKLRCSVIG